MVEIFLTNENKIELIFRAKMIKNIKLKFLFKLFEFQFKWSRVTQIG